MRDPVLPAPWYNYCWRTRKPGKSGKFRPTVAMMNQLADQPWSFDELFAAVLTWVLLGRTEPPKMYEPFTGRSRKAMQLANQEAQRLNHEYIGTEHVLLGIVKEGGGVAVEVLKNLDVNLHEIRPEVEKLVQSGSETPLGKLPQTPRARKVIEHSIEEARNLSHSYVGTEHILLGLLREKQGVAAIVLSKLGVTIGKAREEALRLLASNAHDDLPERE